MKKKRLLLSVLLICAVHCPSGREARAARTIAVSVVLTSDTEPYQLSLEGFRKSLADGGITPKLTEYTLKDKTPAEVSSLIRSAKPDLIFAVGTKAAQAAVEGANGVLLVVTMVLDPRQFSGENVAGVSMDLSAEKKLRELRKILPGAKRVGVIYSPKTAAAYEEIARACAELGLEPVKKAVKAPGELMDALKDISGRIDCFLMVPDTEIYLPQSVGQVMLETLKMKIPVVGLSSFYTKAGALVSFECDYADMGRQSGEIALRVLGGEKPADIRFVPPRKMKYSLNMTTAGRCGLKLPQAAIDAAGEVVER